MSEGMGGVPPGMDGGRPQYAPPTNRARSFRDFLSGYAGAPKRIGPYDRHEDPGVYPAGAGGPRAAPGSPDDPTMALVSRTLYLCKLPNDCTEEKVRELVEPFGDIRKITVYSMKQIAFVEYWDIRCSEKARQSLKSAMMGGRKIDCQFSHARNDRARDGNTGTLYVRPVTSDRSFVDPNTLEQYHAFFSPYGEIKKVSANRKREAEKFIEFYDLRAGEGALNALNGKELNGVVLEIQFANHSSKTINQDSRLTERTGGRRYPPHQPYEDSGYYDPRGAPAAYGPPAGSMMGRMHPYPTMPPAAAAAPIDPYGYAPPPMMGGVDYWSYMWASQQAAAAMQQPIARGPGAAPARAPNPYRP